MKQLTIYLAFFWRESEIAEMSLKDKKSEFHFSTFWTDDVFIRFTKKPCNIFVN